MNKGLVPLTERQKTLIVNNVLAACKDINKLNSTGYNFLYQASGFIAHYNRFGFMDFYERESLTQDIINNARNNEWRNFRAGEQHYDYYMAKADVYKRILVGLGAISTTNVDLFNRW